MAKERNRLFELFVLLLLTLGIATIGILYLRERSKARTPYANINPDTQRNFNFNTSMDNGSYDLLNKIRKIYLNPSYFASLQQRSQETNVNDQNQSNNRHQAEDTNNHRQIEEIHTDGKDEYLFRKAVLHYKHFRYDDAIKTVDELILNYPNSPYRIRARCYQGMAFMKKGRKTWNRDYLTIARKILVQFLEKYSRNYRYNPREFTDFVIAVGEANRSIGGTNAHIEFLLKKSIGGAPEAHRSELYVQLGFIELFRNQYELAMSFLSKSNSELARIGMARTYIKLGKYDKGLDLYNELIKYNKDSQYYPDIKTAFVKLSLYYSKIAFSKKDYAAVYKYLKRLLTHFPNTKNAEHANFLIAEAFFMKKAYRFARKYYNFVISNETGKLRVKAIYRIGQTYYNERKLTKALKFFDIIISEYPDSRFKNDSENYRKNILNDIRNSSGAGNNMLDNIRNEDENRNPNRNSRTNQGASNLPNVRTSSIFQRNNMSISQGR